MNTNKITINKEYDLKYNIDIVKINIQKLYTESIYKMKYTYMLQKQMDSLHYFRISKMNGLVAVIWDINLKQIDDNNTKIELICVIDAHTNNIAMSTLNSFLERLVMLLEGKEDNEIIANTNKGCLGLLIALFIGLSVVYNLSGCQGGNQDELKKDMKVVMESYIDSIEDDFSTYQFEKIHLDTMFWSDFLYRKYVDKGEFSDISLRDEYKGKYENQLEINSIYGAIDEIFDLTKLYKQTYKRYDSLCNKNRNDWYYIKSNTKSDSIQYVRLRLHYKINNKFNSTVKKTCSYSIRRDKVLSRYIEDGFIGRDSFIGIGKRHLLDK
jgi:hypothetical protein